jgi:hypothetical protein
MNLSTIQTAVIAAVSQILSLVVAFGVMDSVTEGIVVSATTALVNAAFVVANAVENHGKPAA